MTGMEKFERIKEFVAEDLERTENTIFHLLGTENRTLVHSTTHLVKSGGKRIRPLLVLLCGRIYGELDERLYNLAACVELIHLATLMHDDVVDNASLRRGSPSVNSLWGNKISVLTGDFIYSRVFLSLVNLVGSMEAMRSLSRATQIMSVGEIMQVENTGNIDLSERDYFQVVERKTAVFLSACCESAAQLAGAGNKDTAKLRDYGTNLGYAFQIVDDTLDFTSENEQFGKASFKDLVEGKVTLPIIHLLSHSDGNVKEAVKNVMYGLGGEAMDSIRSALHQAGSLSYAQNVAEDFSRRAVTSLEGFKNDGAVNSLIELSHWLVKREW